MLFPRAPRRAESVPRARVLLLGLFALNGLMFSSWLARIPAVRSALDLSTSVLGTVLLAGSLGSLITVFAAGAITTRWGGRAALRASAGIFCLAYVLMGLATAVGSLPLLAVGVFLSGAAFAVGNVPFNVESAAIERRMGRTVIPQFHAAFSVGAVLGSLLGAVMAHESVSVLTQFLWVAGVATVLRVVAVPYVILETLPAAVLAAEAREAVARATASSSHGTPRGSGARALLGAWLEKRTLVIGVVVMAAALSEGSANDWLALAVVDGFGQSEATGALFFGLFVASMTALRLFGTTLIDRYGRVPVLRVSGIVSFAGLMLFGFAPGLALAGVGIVAWGFGAALAIPLGIAAASDDPLRATARVSVVSAFSSTASVAAPPLLGLAAQHVGARQALLLITGAMLLSAVLSRAVAEPERTDVRAGAGAARDELQHLDAPPSTQALTCPAP